MRVELLPHLKQGPLGDIQRACPSGSARVTATKRENRLTKTLTTTVLGRAVGNDGFAVSVAALVREYAQHARDVAGSAFDGPFSARQIQTLEGLAEYIACV